MKTAFSLVVLSLLLISTVSGELKRNQKRDDGLLGGILGGGGGAGAGGGAAGGVGGIVGGVVGEVGGIVGGVVGDVNGIVGGVLGTVSGLLNGLVGEVGGILGSLPNVLNVVIQDVEGIVDNTLQDVEILVGEVVGAVFSLTDELLGNRIAVFPRLADGTISQQANLYATGGLGSGGNGTGHLGSQHSIAISSSGDRLYACNPGSDSVSIFAISPIDFSLRLLAVVDSGGEFPIAVALSADDRTLFVLNAGGLGRLASIDVSVFLSLSVNLPGLLDLNLNLALNLGLLGRAPNSAIVLNQNSSSPSSGASGPSSTCTTAGVSDLAVSPDGNWVLVANKATGSIISLRLNAGLLLPIQLGLPIINSLLNLGLAVDLNVAGVNVDLGVAANIGAGGIALGIGAGVSIAPLSLSFAGTSTLLVGIGGQISGLLTFQFDASTGQLHLISNQTTSTSGGSGAAAGAGSGSGSGSGSSSNGGSASGSGTGTYIANTGNTVVVNHPGLGLGGLLTGVLGLVDGVLQTVNTLVDDVVIIADHLLYDVVVTVDGIIYTLGLGGILCGFKPNASGALTQCNCANPNGLLQGLAVL